MSTDNSEKKVYEENEGAEVVESDSLKHGDYCPKVNERTCKTNLVTHTIALLPPAIAGTVCVFDKRVCACIEKVGGGSVIISGVLRKQIKYIPWDKDCKCYSWGGGKNVVKVEDFDIEDFNIENTNESDEEYVDSKGRIWIYRWIEEEIPFTFVIDRSDACSGTEFEIDACVILQSDQESCCEWKSIYPCRYGNGYGDAPSDDMKSDEKTHVGGWIKVVYFLNEKDVIKVCIKRKSGSNGCGCQDLK